jgi:1-acyl-sn-glycerol-3-phosphate acyltransferase
VTRSAAPGLDRATTRSGRHFSPTTSHLPLLTPTPHLWHVGLTPAHGRMIQTTVCPVDVELGAVLDNLRLEVPGSIAWIPPDGYGPLDLDASDTPQRRSRAADTGRNGRGCSSPDAAARCMPNRPNLSDLPRVRRRSTTTGPGHPDAPCPCNRSAGAPACGTARDGNRRAVPNTASEVSSSYAWRTSVAVGRATAFSLCWRVSVEGLEHVPRSGPAVIVFNHHSALDSVMLAWGPAVELGRQVRFLAKQELTGLPVVGSAMRSLGAIPVQRGSREGRSGAARAARAALTAGHLVAIAPEQTRSTSFELLPFRQGAARLALETGAPLIPCVGWGSQRLLRRERTLPRVRDLDIAVRFLPPAGTSGRTDPATLTAEVRNSMERELHTLQASYPGGAPSGASWVPRRLGGSAPSREEGELELARRAERWQERDKR